MEITYIEGDLLESDVDVICHQVNCRGRMRSGIAKQIREKYPDVYTQYTRLVYFYNETDRELLSNVLTVVGDKDDPNSPVIANIFSQKDYGYDDKQYTDYDALNNGLIDINKKYPDKNIGIPYKIGCGLGGGDWSVAERIITDVFKDKTNGSVRIYKLPERKD